MKLIEEGPAYACFLFLSPQPGLLLPTIRSRCETLRAPGEETRQADQAGETLADLILTGASPRDRLPFLLSLEKKDREEFPLLLEAALSRLAAELPRRPDLLPVLDRLGPIRAACEFPVSTRVTGHVDWNRRFDFMQQHSGEHMISGLLHSHFGLENVGFHLSDREVTLDMNGEVSLEQLRLIEQEANAYVWKNLPVNISWPSSEELLSLNYRSKLALTENVRIVEIPGVDLCACCAPHVDTTGQIGLIKVVNVQSHRGGVRINILCGNRALADYTEKQDSVWAISSLLSAKQPEVAGAVARAKEDARLQKERANALQAELLNVQMDALPSPEKVRHVLLFVGELDAIALRNAVNTLTGKYSGYCGIFAGDDTNGYRFIVGSASCNCQ